jgi:cyclophilin family peptidyl-prolyl cis-trans isomerase
MHSFHGGDTGMQKLLTVILVVVVAAALTVPAFSQEKEMEKKAEGKKAEETKAAKNPQVYVKTNVGGFTIELYPDKAPVTVANFLNYVEKGFYSGTTFHRVIKGFMIQGGGFTTDMTQKSPAPPIKNEAHNGLKNKKYTLAMARTNVVDSATSQFFINTVNNTGLDHRDKSQGGYGYCVFGKVIDGTDTIDKIEMVKTTTKGSYADVPVKPVVIKAMTLMTDED